MNEIQTKDELKSNLRATVEEAGGSISEKQLEEAANATVEGIVKFLAPRIVKDIPAIEVYKAPVLKGLSIVVVHERARGGVFFHRQTWNETEVPVSRYDRLQDFIFDAALRDQGAILIDKTELPAFGGEPLV